MRQAADLMTFRQRRDRKWRLEALRTRPALLKEAVLKVLCTPNCFLKTRQTMPHVRSEIRQFFKETPRRAFNSTLHQARGKQSVSGSATKKFEK